MTSILGKQALNRRENLDLSVSAHLPPLALLDINQDGEDPNFRVRPGLLFYISEISISRFPLLDEQGCPLPPP